MATVNLIISPTPADPKSGTFEPISLHPGQHQPPLQMLQNWQPQWSSCSADLLSLLPEPTVSGAGCPLPALDGWQWWYMWVGA